MNKKKIEIESLKIENESLKKRIKELEDEPKKIYLNGNRKNLPRGGQYQAHNMHTDKVDLIKGCKIFSIKHNEWWLNNIDWYLLPEEKL
jgi:hypothetical protein